jgi:thiamine transport system substrate-binding protein
LWGGHRSEIKPVEPALGNTSEGKLNPLCSYPAKVTIKGFTMKKALIILLILLSFNCAEKDENSNSDEIVVYAYDSFFSDWGPGPIIIPKFEELTGYKVRAISLGDAQEVLNRAILEKDNPKADVIIGIDNNMLSKALKAEVLSSYQSHNLDKIDESLIFDKTYNVSPYDYGFFSIIYDTEKIDTPPSSMEELLSPNFEDKIILMDPRTSSPGLGFLLWTIDIYGDNFTGYWEKLLSNVLTITDGWSSGYGLFTSGEAPMVLSYTTSPAYHVEYEDTNRYQAVIFEEGNYIQIEGAGIIKNCPNRKGAETFIDFLLSEGFQKEVALTNWMFPVNTSLPLPESFDYALKPEKSLQIDYMEIEDNLSSWIDEWLKVVQ